MSASPGSWHRYDERRDVLVLELHVQPNASRTEVAGLHGGRLKVRVAAPPADDRANEALLHWLKGKLDLPGGRVMIRRGGHGRAKTIEIAQPGPALLQRLNELLQP